MLGCTVRRRFSIQRSRSAKELHPKERLCPPVMICGCGEGQGATGGVWAQDGGGALGTPMGRPGCPYRVSWIPWAPLYGVLCAPGTSAECPACPGCISGISGVLWVPLLGTLATLGASIGCTYGLLGLPPPSPQHRYLEAEFLAHDAAVHGAHDDVLPAEVQLGRAGRWQQGFVGTTAARGPAVVTDVTKDPPRCPHAVPTACVPFSICANRC